MSQTQDTQLPANRPGGRQTPVAVPINAGHAPPPGGPAQTPGSPPREEIMTDAASVSSGTARVRGRGFASKLRGAVKDYGAGKSGVASEQQAKQILDIMMDSIEFVDDNDAVVKVSALTDVQKVGFEAALYCYLALNTGSANGEDGLGAGGAVETELIFEGHVIPAALIRQAFDGAAYRFMRRRATEIHETIKFQYERARGMDARSYPQAVEFCRDMDVVATRRGMSRHQTMAFVGAEHIDGINEASIAMILAASANVLGSRENVHDVNRKKIMDAERLLK